MQKHLVNRRYFSKLSAAAIAASAPAMNVLGANEKINLGFIGQGGRGSHHFRQFLQFDDVNIVALCDAYKPNFERNAEKLSHSIQTTQDFRHVLENKDVDAVIIASPDHWHAHQAIYACQA
ncbi:gfo/Idh/MocA family oxidoreductase, partial [bacterium]|nr:gfo/Idh/MocA family oxidoreductase [bacterium]